MKNIIFLFKIIIGFVFIFTTACSKYEEGPFISFQSKEKRLINTWEISEISINGENMESGCKTIYNFNEDGTGYISYLAADSYLEWKFNENKEQLLIRHNTEGEYQSYKIIRLSKDELWLQDVWEGNVTTMKYIPKLY